MYISPYKESSFSRNNIGMPAMQAMHVLPWVRSHLLPISRGKMTRILLGGVYDFTKFKCRSSLAVSFISIIYFAVAVASCQDEGEYHTGTVKWFNENKGYGFLTQDGGGPDVFVHYTAIEGEGYRTLEEGQKVRFTVEHGVKGPTAGCVATID